jgi:hypothetical protein
MMRLHLSPKRPPSDRAVKSTIAHRWRRSPVDLGTLHVLGEPKVLIRTGGPERRDQAATIAARIT